MPVPLRLAVAVGEIIEDVEAEKNQRAGGGKRHRGRGVAGYGGVNAERQVDRRHEADALVDLAQGAIEPDKRGT